MWCGVVRCVCADGGIRRGLRATADGKPDGVFQLRRHIQFPRCFCRLNAAFDESFYIFPAKKTQFGELLLTWLLPLMGKIHSAFLLPVPSSTPIYITSLPFCARDDSYRINIELPILFASLFAFLFAFLCSIRLCISGDILPPPFALFLGKL